MREDDDFKVLEHKVGPYFSVTSGNILESSISNVGYGANTISFLKTNGTMRRFAKFFPGLYAEYRRACLDGRMNVGKTFRFFSASHSKAVFSLGIQSFPGPFASLRYVESSLDEALALIKLDDLSENVLAIPAIGCGSGGLSWKRVEPIVARLSEKHKVHVVAYIA